MAMTTYQREMSIETIANCRKAIDNLEQQVKWENEKSARLISGWKTRIDDCKATITHLTEELERS